MKANRKILIWVGVTFLLISVAVLVGCYRSSPNPVATTDNVADAVLRTKKIRAGYAVVSPAVLKDPNTGELSGIFIDAMREIGRRLSLEVEFTEEVAWDSMIAGLNARRYDVIATQIWPSAPRARDAAFSRPLYYTAVGIYVRSDDHRFDNDISLLNAETVRVTGIEGASSIIIGQTDFPKAKLTPIAGAADTNQQFLEVVSKKADVVFLDTYQGEAYIRSNPGSLRNIVPDRPIRVFPDTFMVKRDEFHLLTMLDTTIGELQNSGYLDKLIKKYVDIPNAVLSPANEYRAPLASAPR